MILKGKNFNLLFAILSLEYLYFRHTKNVKKTLWLSRLSKIEVPLSKNIKVWIVQRKESDYN